MNEYLLKIKNLVDLLVLVVTIFAANDHVEVINDEYETFILSTIARNDGFSVEVFEALLLSQEARIDHNSQLDPTRH